MKLRIGKAFALLTMVMLVAVSTINAKGGSETKVTIEKVSQSLADYKGVENRDFVSDSITYEEVGKANYDDIFTQSAIIYATIAQVGGTVDIIEKEEMDKDVAFAAVSIKFAVEDLSDMDNRIKSLQSSLKQLKPKADFKGKDMRKAPKATQQMQIASQRLDSSLKALPGLIEQVSELNK